MGSRRYLSIHVRSLLPVPSRLVTYVKSVPTRKFSTVHCCGEGAVGGKRSNDFTCSLLVQGYLTLAKEMGDVEAASVKEAKEELSEQTLRVQH